MGGAFPTKPDTQLKHLQSTVIAVAAPILNLWAELEEQEVTTAQGGLIPVKVVLECFQKMLVLLGNASNYMSLNHRDIIIRKIIQKSKGLGRLMNSVCKESKLEGTQLFGTAVHKAITERAETMSALSKTASKAHSSGDCKKFFRGGPTSGYGSGSGKNVRLYNKGNQNSQFKNRGLQQYLRPCSTNKVLHKPVTQLLQFGHPIGGRLCLFSNSWSQITKDPWILQVVSGHHIEFIEPLTLARVPALQPPLSPDQSVILSV